MSSTDPALAGESRLATERGQRRLCMTRSAADAPAWYCSRDKGHDGPHVAWPGHEPHRGAVWSGPWEDGRPFGMVDSGLMYCTAHHGVIECDEGDGPCDFLDHRDPEHRCPTCSGTGVNPDDADEQCEPCDGDGTTPCTPTPLLYDSGGAT